MTTLLHCYRCKTTDWHGCYDGGWQGLILPEAFAHPAKFAYGLITRIIDHGLRQGYWKPGDLVGDPFGGVALGGIAAGSRGLNWIGVELEFRFVELGQANLAKHRAVFAASGASAVGLMQGDSRRFAEIIRQCPSCGGDGRARMDGRDVGACLVCDGNGVSPVLRGGVSAVVTSPPYAEDVVHGRPSKMTKGIFAGRTAATGLGDYGKTPGQIGKLPAGSVDAVVTSPPYADGCVRTGGADIHPEKVGRLGCGSGWSEYGDSRGQIGNLKGGSLDAVVTSPPYAESIQGDHAEKETAAESRSKRRTAGGSLGQSCRHGGYGATAGNIGNLKGGTVDAVVTSPPFMSTHAGHEDSEYFAHIGGVGGVGAKYSDESPVNSTTGGDRTSKAAREAQKQRAENTANIGCIVQSGNTGLVNVETYWEAVAQVYAQIRLALKPGGILAVVVKDYVAKGARVRLCDQTAELLTRLGFHVFERTRCWLVKETREPSLFGGEEVKRTERKSFFRRLHEKKLPEGDERRIDWEEVLWAASPPSG